MNRQLIAEQIDNIYRWIDLENQKAGFLCQQCGECCDFAGFGHKLFVTNAELIHLAEKMVEQKAKKMTGDICPYNHKGKCQIHDNRFISCRIFCCNTDTQRQRRLSEEALKKIKNLCIELGIGYLYMDLAVALNNCEDILSGGTRD